MKDRLVAVKAKEKKAFGGFLNKVDIWTQYTKDERRHGVSLCLCA